VQGRKDPTQLGPLEGVTLAVSNGPNLIADNKHPVSFKAWRPSYRSLEISDAVLNIKTGVIESLFFVHHDENNDVMSALIVTASFCQYNCGG
jgi:hypothetical protein